MAFAHMLIWSFPKFVRPPHEGSFKVCQNGNCFTPLQPGLNLNTCSESHHTHPSPPPHNGERRDFWELLTFYVGGEQEGDNLDFFSILGASLLPISSR